MILSGGTGMTEVISVLGMVAVFAIAGWALINDEDDLG